MHGTFNERMMDLNDELLEIMISDNDPNDLT